MDKKNQKRARVELTLSKKFEIIKYVEQLEENNKKVTQKSIAEKFELKSSTISDILKSENRQKTKSLVMSANLSANIKRFKTSRFPATEKALLEWFAGIRNARPDLAISGEMLRVKATELARSLNELSDQDEIDLNFINRWKANHEVCAKKLCGESSTVSQGLVDTWKQLTLPETLKKYAAEDVLNCDECGLFYLLAPDKTLAFKGEQVHGGKRSKERITVLNTCSMTGEKFPLLVIGKFLRPRCFKNVKKLPVNYRANTKAWMTGDLFREYLQSLNESCKRKNRKVALILDRCTAHPHVDLSNVELIFLPANTTSKTQPLDAGIIHSMKCQYRKLFINKLLACYENEVEFKFNILDALKLIKVAWGKVTKETIVNCFKHVGFYGTVGPQDEEQATEGEENDSRLEGLKKFMDVGCSFNEFVEIDENLQTCATLSNEDIVAVFSDNQSMSQDDAEELDDTEPIKIPTNKEVISAFNTIQNYLLVNDDIDEIAMDQIHKIQSTIEAKMVQSKQQKKITDFFKN